MTATIRDWVSADIGSARGRLASGVLDLIPPERMREQVDGGGIPPIYVLWHMARHHDVAINGVLRGVDEVVHDFTDSLGVADGLWRGLSEGADLDLVEVLDPEIVNRYATATLDNTAEWLSNEATLNRLDNVPDSVSVLEALGTPPEDFGWLYDMWDGKTRQWFLSWEGHGHIVTHTGELVSIRNRMGLSPF